MATTPSQFGRYRLLDLLGHGGMGEVFRAHDTETDRVVAIKLLPTHLADDPEFQQRFRREARVAAGLNDPHVVPIHNYGDIDGRLYVDMRLIEGHDLGTLLAAEGGRLVPWRAVAIIGQVATALDTAHRVGLVHRDVKPSNILVAERDFVYLIDFGIARAAGDTAMTGTGHTVGTLAYMAPERFGGNTDVRADVYALACVLYESLTGRRPYPGDSLEQQLAGHLSAPPPQPSLSYPDIPAGLDAVIARGMAKDPDQRYQTATDLADAARTALGDRPAVGATPATPWGPPTQFAPPATTSAAPVAALSVRAARYAVIALIMLVGAYLVFAVVTGTKHTEPGVDQVGGVRTTLTARTLDGSKPSQEALDQARQVIQSRAKKLGIPGAQVTTDDSRLVVTVPTNHADDLRGLVMTGRLYLRPVISSVPAQAGPSADPTGGPAPAPAPAAPSGSLAERIASEKKWRQSASQPVQMIGLQYQATRCDQADILAGNDDPTLPLITCSTDHRTAYLLAPSIISGEQVKEATTATSQSGGGHVVDLQFKADAADTWAKFTAEQVGVQVGFTLDTQVVSAPVIREAIPGGRTQISGGQPPFTEATARQLAAVLNSSPLPLAFEASEREAVAPKPLTPSRRKSP